MEAWGAGTKKNGEIIAAIILLAGALVCEIGERPRAGA
jgi:hypothetical protein